MKLRALQCPTCVDQPVVQPFQAEKSVEFQMVCESSGARGRSDATACNQALGGVQPSGLTDESLPSPAAALSNLFDVIPRSGISRADRALALRAGEVG